MNLLFSDRSALFAIRIVGLVFVLVMALAGMLRNGFNSDLLLLVLLLGVWFLIVALISAFQNRLNWHENTTSLLTCAMDAYFAMTALNLAATPPHIALLTLAAFCFAVAFATGPALGLTSFLTGLIGFMSAYVVTAHSWRPSIPSVIVVPLLGAFCGLAWRIVVPLLWKAIQLIAADPDAVKRGAAPGAASAEATLDAAPSLAALQEEKARLAADLENVRAEVDMLKILSAKRQKSFEVAEKEKEALKLELETAQKEMDKMFGMDTSTPTQAVAPAAGPAAVPAAAAAVPDTDLQASITEFEKELVANPAAPAAAVPDSDVQVRMAGLEKELAAARVRIEQVESEKKALADELEKTGAELMKAYGA